MVSPTPGVVAVIVRVYLPGVSFLVRDSQPLKRTVLSPAWPAKVGEGRCPERTWACPGCAVHRRLVGGLGELEAHGSGGVERVLEGRADRGASAADLSELLAWRRRGTWGGSGCALETCASGVLTGLAVGGGPLICSDWRSAAAPARRIGGGLRSARAARRTGRCAASRSSGWR